MHHRFAVLSAVFLVVLVHAGAVLLDLPPPRLGETDMLAGPDAYMRLLRVEQLWRTGAWYDAAFPMTNAPYGEISHWTRPFDVLLLAGAWPLSGLVNAREALFAWGVVVSPLLQVLLVLALSWGLRPFLSSGGFLLLVVLMVLQPSLYNAFMAARPDHQSLQILLFGLGFVMLFRVLAGKSPPGLAHWTGAVAGLAIWVSVEGLVPVFVACATLGLLWLWEGGGHGRTLRRYLTGLALVVILAVVVERPPGDWLNAELDRISIVHAVLFTGLSLVWGVVGLLSSPGPAIRLSAGLAATLLPAAVLFLAVPDFFAGPLARLDPRIWPIFVAAIGEFQPLLSGGLRSGGKVAILLGPVVLGLGYAFHSVFRGGETARAGGLYLSLALILFTGLALNQVRWGHYAVMLMIIPWTLLVARAWRWRGGLTTAAGRVIPLRAPLALVLLTGHVAVAGFLIVSTEVKTDPFAGAKRPCLWQDMAAPLQEASAGGQSILLSFVREGPEIVYRTGYRVVGSPYHRNQQGIFDTYTVLTAREPEKARAILQSRGVDFIVYCRTTGDIPRYLGMNGDTLFKRLYNNQPPPWLKEVRITGNAGGQFQLFQVEK